MVGEINIWLDNAEVLPRALWRRICKEIKGALVHDFDLWMEMEALLDCLRLPITWKRVDSHIATKVYAPGVLPKGYTFSI